MVTYRTEANTDLEDILYGLLTWNKHYISEEHARNYVDDIKDICNSLDKRTFHFNAVYEDHCKYGSSVAFLQKKQQYDLVYNLRY
ncbi:MAG: hypothetical protein LBN95_01550 [Prevotellaceae bacterium]|jgi:hypothetical protein|nr:hypothetical protein [Prevotellaceae bacterium]